MRSVIPSALVAILLSSSPALALTTSDLPAWPEKDPAARIWKDRYQAMCDALIQVRPEIDFLDRPEIDRIYASSHCDEFGPSYEPATHDVCQGLKERIESAATGIKEWYALATRYSKQCRGS